MQLNQIVLVVLEVLQQHITDKTAILFGEYMQWKIIANILKRRIANDVGRNRSAFNISKSDRGEIV